MTKNDSFVVLFHRMDLDVDDKKAINAFKVILLYAAYNNF